MDYCRPVIYCNINWMKSEDENPKKVETSIIYDRYSFAQKNFTKKKPIKIAQFKIHPCFYKKRNF